MREGRYELAVLLSQTLLELRVEAELADYFKTIREERFGDAALGLLPSYNIGNGRVQTFFERLVDEKLRDADADAMAALREHVERRNRVAHHFIRSGSAHDQSLTRRLAAIYDPFELPRGPAARPTGEAAIGEMPALFVWLPTGQSDALARAAFELRAHNVSWCPR